MTVRKCVKFARRNLGGRKFVCKMIAIAGTIIVPGLVHAQAIITPTITTLSNGAYHYNYSITNTSTNDLFDVDIQVLGRPGVVFNVGTPSGFNSLYDSGLGLVSYIEDTGVFSTNTAVTGFVYDSFIAPELSSFTANLTPPSGGIITTNGSTLAAVPEPGSLAFVGAISAVSLLAARRKRRSAAK